MRAGHFSAALSEAGQFYVWGEGFFGKFYRPCRIKSGKSLEIMDFEISRRGLAALINR